MVDSKGRINAWAENNPKEFMEKFLNIKMKGHMRGDCPFCGGRNTLSYSKEHLWGCFYSTCNHKIGDSIQLFILLRNNISKETYDMLDKQKQASLFKESVQYLEKEIGEKALLELKPLTNDNSKSDKIVLEKLPLFSTTYRKYVSSKGYTGTLSTDAVPSTWRRFEKSTLKTFKIFDVNSKFSFLNLFHYYPIYDENGVLVGAQGRKKYDNELTKEQLEKFKETEKAFNFPNVEKSKMVFGLYQALTARREGNFCGGLVIHEGPADVMRAWERGHHNCVSTLGCKVSDYQTELLYKCFGDIPVLLFFDNDLAGLEGSLASAKKLKKKFTNVFFTRLEVSNDADSCDEIEYARALKQIRKLDALSISELERKIEKEKNEMKAVQ